MQRRTTFETVPLDQIEHLIVHAEYSDAESDGPTTCQECGHPASDHELDSETCWHEIRPTDDIIKLCCCRGYRGEGLSSSSIGVATSHEPMHDGRR